MARNPETAPSPASGARRIARTAAAAVTAEERQAYKATNDKLKGLSELYCSSCAYCNVCPQEIAIPKIFAIYNEFQTGGNWAKAIEGYKALGEHSAEKCISCGLCVEQCPQNIPIFEKLAQVHKRFA